MKKKNLIFLTKQFPYLNREQYVAHELEFLAKTFEKVYIYPHDHFGKEDVKTFQLPSNVEVINLNRRISKLVHPTKVALSFFSDFLIELMKVHDKLWFLKNAKRFFHIYTTQYALGNGLMEFMESKNLKKADVVYYSYWFSASALCLSILKSRGLIDRFVSRAHALDLYNEDWGLLNDKVGALPFRNFKEKNVDTLYVISKHGKDYLEKKNRVIHKVEVAYLGVKDQGMNPENPEECFVIVTCSGVDSNKRIHKLGEALSRINLPVRWIHFGDGPMKAEALSSITSEKIDFVYKGQTPNDEIRQYYSFSHVDLFVNLSIVEGLPVTIMEALSHGIPVLATNVNGTPEAVVENKSGVLLKVNFNEPELDDALRLLMIDQKKLIPLRAGAREIFIEKFNANKNYSAFGENISA